jgi:hypothetical protein
MSGIKRLLVSLTGGILVPFSYFLLIVPFIELTRNQALGAVLLMPLVWPRVICILLFGPAENQTTYMLVTIVCDVILYGLITYGVLLALYRERPRLEPPPPPPQF